MYVCVCVSVIVCVFMCVFALAHVRRLAVAAPTAAEFEVDRLSTGNSVQSHLFVTKFLDVQDLFFCVAFCFCIVLVFSPSVLIRKISGSLVNTKLCWITRGYGK